RRACDLLNVQRGAEHNAPPHPEQGDEAEAAQPVPVDPNAQAGLAAPARRLIGTWESVALSPHNQKHFVRLSLRLQGNGRVQMTRVHHDGRASLVEGTWHTSVDPENGEVFYFESETDGDSAFPYEMRGSDLVLDPGGALFVRFIPAERAALLGAWRVRESSNI